MTDRRFESISNILNKPRQARSTPPQAAFPVNHEDSAEGEPEQTQRRLADSGTGFPSSESEDDGGSGPATVSDIRPQGQAAPAKARADAPTGSTTAQRARTRAERPAVSRAADGGARRVALRLDPELHQALTDEASRQRSSHGNIVVTAVERAHVANALRSQSDQPDQSDQSGDGMFPRLQTRRDPQPTVLTEVRLHRKAVDTIDGLVAHHHVASRTELITRALRWHFSTAHDQTEPAND